jgi:hypothetical protein
VGVWGLAVAPRAAANDASSNGTLLSSSLRLQPRPHSHSKVARVVVKCESARRPLDAHSTRVGLGRVVGGAVMAVGGSAQGRLKARPRRAIHSLLHTAPCPTCAITSVRVLVIASLSRTHTHTHTIHAGASLPPSHRQQQPWRQQKRHSR